MDKKMNLAEWLVAEKSGDFKAEDVDTQIKAGWYDWFCSNKSLPKRLKSMIPFVHKVAKALEDGGTDLTTVYVFFKNNCPMNGPLYDDFRICRMDNRDVIYCIAFVPDGVHGKAGRRVEVSAVKNWGKSTPACSYVFPDKRAALRYFTHGDLGEIVNM